MCTSYQYYALVIMLLILRDSPVYAIAYNQHSMVLNCTCIIRVIYLGQVFMPTAKPPTKVYIVLISKIAASLERDVFHTP